MKKYCLKLVCLLALGQTMAANAGTINYNDKVLIHGREPFLMDIFEVSNKQGASLGIIEPWSSDYYKPARFDANEAKIYCDKIGERLPNITEWKEAASNIGRNRYYTTRNDLLMVNGNYLVNVFKVYDEGSLYVHDFKRVGIDAIGTVGMTGNRAEWVVATDGSIIQCGGSYQTRDADNLRLDSICRSSSYESSTATARCITTLKDISLNINLKKWKQADVTIRYTSFVKGDLATYLKDIQAVNRFEVNNKGDYFIDGTQIEAPEDSFIINHYPFFIPKNKYSKKKYNDDTLLELTFPEYSSIDVKKVKIKKKNIK